jgi:hypothetical protein
VEAQGWQWDLEKISEDDTQLTLNLTITKSGTTSIKDAKLKTNIYPNPTNNFVTIEMENYHCSRLYDFKGLLLTVSYNKTIDLQQYSKGVFIIECENKSGTKYYEKLIKY